MPGLDRTFALEDDNALYDRFPGLLSVLNGHKSAHRKVEQGTITFEPGSSASGTVTGMFDVIMTDYDSAICPPPRYRDALTRLSRLMLALPSFNVA